MSFPARPQERLGLGNQRAPENCLVVQEGWGNHPIGLGQSVVVKLARRKDGQFRSGGLLVGDRPFSFARFRAVCCCYKHNARGDKCSRLDFKIVVHEHLLCSVDEEVNNPLAFVSPDTKLGLAFGPLFIGGRAEAGATPHWSRSFLIAGQVVHRSSPATYVPDPFVLRKLST